MNDDDIIDERVKRVLGWMCEAFGMVAFTVLMAVIVLLCCAVSGYHWE